jgi:hypothetical protein
MRGEESFCQATANSDSSPIPHGNNDLPRNTINSRFGRGTDYSLQLPQAPVGHMPPPQVSSAATCESCHSRGTHSSIPNNLLTAVPDPGNPRSMK